MVKNPLRFKRVTEAFDEIARLRPCESSGSEHSAEDSADLSDLVNSFMERGDHQQVEEEDQKQDKMRIRYNSENYWSDSETKEMLQSLLGCDEWDGLEDVVKRKIRAETELACRIIGTNSKEGFKRRLMSQLRERGFDAGLCKSKWEKTGRFPAGYYEYIDVIISGTRYIVEVSLAGEFTIARPTDQHLSLLEVFPQVYVGKPDELKQVVRLMCSATKESMKSRDMHLPPWRSNRYMQIKWFGSYKRTTNTTALEGKMSVSGEGFAGKLSVGLKTLPVSFYCRREEIEVGNLAQVFNGFQL